MIDSFQQLHHVIYILHYNYIYRPYIAPLDSSQYAHQIAYIVEWKGTCLFLIVCSLS